MASTKDKIVSVSSTLALDGGKWVASRPGRFIAGEQPPIPMGWDTGWVSEPVWTLWSFPCRESNLGRPARSPSLYRLSYPG
jgi:hypothetical protein